MSNNMFLYFLEEGISASDNSQLVVASNTNYTKEDLRNIFIQYKNNNRNYNMWSFAKYLQTELNFFYPNYEATLDLEDYK